MVLNSLQIDPNAIWKGVWRWYSEDMLQLCSPPEVVKNKGISISEFGCLAHNNGAQVKVVLASNSDVDEFRAAVKTATSSDTHRLVMSYSRSSLGQTGDGHFSPIGAYHETKDLVLLMDVARFKYPPHWISLPSLFSASLATDLDTGLSRGYAILSAPTLESVFEIMSRMTGTSFQKTATRLWYQLQYELESTPPRTIHDIIDTSLQWDPEDYETHKSWVWELDKKRLSELHQQLINKIQAQIQKTKLYRLVTDVITKSFAGYNLNGVLLTGILLCYPVDTLNSLSWEVRNNLKDFWTLNANETPELCEEVKRLRAAMYPEDRCKVVKCKFVSRRKGNSKIVINSEVK